MVENLEKPKIPVAYRIFAAIGIVVVVLLVIFWLVERFELNPKPNQTPAPPTATKTQQPVYKWKETFQETFALSAGGTYFYGGEAKASTERSQQVRYSLSAQDPVDIYVVRTQSDWRLLDSGREGALMYPDHTAKNVYTYEREMTIPESAGIVIVSKNLFQKNRVELTVWRWVRVQ